MNVPPTASQLRDLLRGREVGADDVDVTGPREDGDRLQGDLRRRARNDRRRLLRDALLGLPDLRVQRHRDDQVDDLARHERAADRVRGDDREADRAPVGTARVELGAQIEDRERLALCRGGEDVAGHELPGRDRDAGDAPEHLVEAREGGLVRLVGDDLADRDVALLDRLAGGDVADGDDDRTHLDVAVGGQAARLEGHEHRGPTTRATIRPTAM